MIKTTIFGLSNQEFWTAVVALAMPIFLYLLICVIKEENTTLPAFKWGNAQRRQTMKSVWTSHFLLGPITAAIVISVLKLMM